MLAALPVSREGVEELARRRSPIRLSPRLEASQEAAGAWCASSAAVQSEAVPDLSRPR